MNTSLPIVHRGFEDFSCGKFGSGGDNLYVNSSGEIEIIHQFDVNGDGHVDIVLPNAHGDIERGPTWLYSQTDSGEWERSELPNDSGWVSHVLDVDGDGFQDLVVVNAENGVTSALDSYVYWGGPHGLTGERTELPTIGAYEMVPIERGDDGLLDLIFTSAWEDHHNPGRPRLLHVYEQTSARSFVDSSGKYGISGLACRAIAGADLNGNGRTDLVVANYRDDYQYDIDSYIYWGTAGGFDTDTPLKLPSHYAMQVVIGDLNNDGWDEVLFAGGSQVWIYWNRDGTFSPDDRTILDFAGESTEFRIGAIFVHVADVDMDGRNELLVAAQEGIEIRKQDSLQKTEALISLSAVTWLDTADLNGSGFPDIIASRYQDGKMYDCDSAVFWNDGGCFDGDRATWLATKGAMGCVAADINQDGKPEVIFNSTRQGLSVGNEEFPIYVYLGNERNDYRVDRRLDLPSGGSNTYAIADLNHDGYPDLICSSKQGLRVFTGGPDGISPDRYYSLTGGQRIRYVLVADLNHDGWLDLVAIAGSMDYSPEALAASSVIYYGSSEGFSLENSQPLPTCSRGAAMLADVNGDGWLDIICPDRRGYLGFFLGGPEGYSEDRMLKIPLDGIDVGFVPAVSVADLNGDGWLDIIVSYMGHYNREQSGYFILHGGAEGYSEKRMDFHPTDASSILISAADLNSNGCLDLLVPAYSTQFSRELPAFVHWGDENGIDFDNPLAIPCDSCCAFWSADITGNGFNDLLAVCHRNDLGHQVESMLFWNGPDGLDLEHPARIPGLGPHLSSARDFGNAYTREPVEHYVSAPLEIPPGANLTIWWEADTPHRTELRFEVRSANSESELSGRHWLGPEGPGSFYHESGSVIPADSLGAWLQYRAGFVSPNGCGTPKLREVRIEGAGK